MVRRGAQPPMRVGDAGEGYALLRHDGADDGSSRSIGGLIMTSEPETESETEAEKAWNSVTRLERRQDEAQVCVSESGALHRYMVALRELRSGFVLDKVSHIDVHCGRGSWAGVAAGPGPGGTHQAPSTDKDVDAVWCMPRSLCS